MQAAVASESSETAAACMQALPFSVGTVLPIAATAFALFLGDGQLITATCLAPYLLTLFCQIWMEGAFAKTGAHNLHLTV